MYLSNNALNYKTRPNFQKQQGLLRLLYQQNETINQHIPKCILPNQSRNMISFLSWTLYVAKKFQFSSGSCEFSSAKKPEVI